MDRENIRKRIKRVRTKFLEQNLDAVVVMSDANRRYLSGYTGEDGSYDETAGILVITESQLILAADPRYDTQAANETDLYRVVCYKSPLEKELTATLASLGTKKVGVETGRITCQQYKKIEEEIAGQKLDMALHPADDILKTLRIQKDDNEISAIKAALTIAEDSFLEFRQALRPGMTEKEVAWLLEKTMRTNGADDLSFPVIAASGENSALPHAIPGDRRLSANEPLLFDFGARLHGYCSDTTRTLVMGEPDTTFKEAYDTLFSAQQRAVDQIKPGAAAKSIDKIARDHIDATRFKGMFEHSLGHGVGLAIHEAPRLSKRDDTVLAPGMVVTVEPGIYIPGWGGIRLENMILVTSTGAEVLNTMGYEDFVISCG
ncbi:MAG TPA: aminopeptidase P family protein [Desulfobacteraceae bacterium]|nr:aminopeptidase P family protein [Desulfobacteraceae bacterium]